MTITEVRVSFRVAEDNSMWLPFVTLISLEGINAFLPPVALLYVFHHHTQNTIKHPPPGFTPHFVIFAPEDGIA
jgi:hypothetical protein